MKIFGLLDCHILTEGMVQAHRYWLVISLVMVLILAIRGPGPAAAQDVENSAARLSGRVWSVEGIPLSNAVVKISGPAHHSVKTDGDGNFHIQVEPGTYQLEASRIGYLSAKYKTEDSASPVTPLTVEARQHISNLHFRLSKGGVITGQILYENGEPVIGDEVIVLSKEKGAARILLPVRELMFTDDRGRYRIFGLPSGRYYVGMRVGDRLFGQKEFLAYYPGVNSLSQALEVVVHEGAETPGIDFRVKSGPSEALKIFGRIARGDTGEAMSGVEVIAFAVGHTRPWFGRSDMHGYYEIKDMVPGQYKVELSTRQPLSGDVELVRPLAQEVLVERGASEANFEVGRGGQISGRVMLDNGRPARDATAVSLSAQPLASVDFKKVTARPDREGRFALKALPRGTYRINIDLNKTSSYLKSILLDDQDVTAGDIPVEWGSDTGGIRVVLSEAGAQVHGQVLGEKGPVAGMPVGLIPVEAVDGHAPDSVFKIMAVTDQRGQFQIKALPPGRYFAIAFTQHSPDSGPDDLKPFVRAHAERFQTVELKEKESKEIKITVAASPKS